MLMCMPSKPSAFDGEIKVASRIVDLLSSGLYDTPAACLKELINNSYDADATHVNVFVKPEADRIIIEDNGIGMNRDEFQKHFDHVAESHKRETSEFTPSGRPKIGKIGIGFIAANEICDLLEIHSTKAGSKELLKVEINFAMMRQDPSIRRRDGTEYAKADYRGSISSAPLSDHYTHLFLKNIRSEVRRVFSGAGRRVGPSTKLSLYGLKPESVCRILATPDIRSWDVFDAYSETLLRVALNVPVRYCDEVSKSARQRDLLSPFILRTRQLNFSLKYDGTEMRKPIVFTAPAQKSFVHTFSLKGEFVSADGYFYVQSGVLKPQDLNGLLIRIRNSAIGDYDQTFMDYPSERGTLFQKWISAELWASDGLEEALNIDRKTLRDTHEAVVELRKMLHEELTTVIARARKELHGKNSAVKKTERVSLQANKLHDLAKSSGITKAQSIQRRIRESVDDPSSSQSLSKSYTPSQMYEIVSAILSDLDISAKTREEILSRLLERLLD